ncbi:MAG: hypothetical protein NTX86_05310 [Candidatus Dependentiae bacterium]|nr:hypothetical protein [Candidatus Dependentiae bacterium]
MKKLILSLTICGSLYTPCAQATKPQEHHEIILVSPIIDFIDGFSLGVNAKTIKLMLQVRREIKKIQFGEVTKKKELKGLYLFDGEFHSVRTLAALESEYEAEFYQKETTYTKNSVNNRQVLEDLEASYNRLKKEFGVCLKQAKKDFEGKVSPFTKNARGAKDQMLILITESCTKRNRQDCLLLKWADTDENNDMQFFNEQINSFKTFDQFCTDLTHFLEDLMRSCPKAWAQFKKLMDEQHLNHAL